jgi:hypothetical protein
LERREPLQEIQIDFKDNSTVPTDPLGKQQHVVETGNFVDAGTSIWLHAPVREDFTAETALEVVAEFLRQYGLPPMLTFDRDPRLSWAVPAGATFPRPLSVSGSAWASSLTSVRRIGPTKTRLWNGCTGPTKKSGGFCIAQARCTRCVR